MRKHRHQNITALSLPPHFYTSAFSPAEPASPRLVLRMVRCFAACHNFSVYTNFVHLGQNNHLRALHLDSKLYPRL